MIVALTVLLAPPAVAIAKTTPKPVVLRPSFHPVARQVSDVIADDRYLFFDTDTYASGPEGALTGEFGTLIDNDSGRRLRLSPPGCKYFGTPQVGGDWLALSCEGATQQVELYDLAAHDWSSVTRGCANNDDQSCTVVGVGTHWFRYEVSCYHCEDVFLDQNIRTGKVRKDPEVPGGRQIANLNSGSLVQNLCPPLRVPRSEAPTPGTEFEAGSLVFYGRFAVASGYPRILGNGTNDPYFFLARCGSRLHENVDVWSSPPPASAPVPQRAVVGDAKAVAWLAAEHKLAALSLPALHRFTVQRPAGADEELPAFQPGAHGQPNIYIRYTDGAESGSLWAAKLPLR